MKKKLPVMLLCLFLLGAFYNLWTIRPVNILYVYSQEGVTVTIVVDHMPWTDQEKISWYLARRDDFKRKYPYFGDIWQSYYITDVSDGFTNYEKSPHEDLFCIPTIKSENNCLVKDYFLIVREDPDSNTHFYLDSENEYQLTPDNKIERIFRPEYLNQ
ncbi:DUF943 family protein [Lelliottia wanjuensis]|uniref:DUF943 family protein n=1 Tax=Lelliottia wanjuensis TaxID=3050585 RepID=A0AAP4FWD0_9ENTR|nr:MULTISPECIES: DUF943 family protein [unclassified Lelliottia]MDK9362827.1 DUF943 family protein [Lelliottia sp. V106_12]MDK9583333.1 DUF943 family protein [Lelliottia sp. V86_10]MDK9615155.1 DUF943 family protein [Lelliottia sp. V106_9]